MSMMTDTSKIRNLARGKSDIDELIFVQNKDSKQTQVHRER